MVLYVPSFRDPTVSMNVEEPQLSQKAGLLLRTVPQRSPDLLKPTYHSADTSNNTRDRGAKYTGLAGDHCLLARIQGLQTGAS
jgi:hypothetical protein